MEIEKDVVPEVTAVMPLAEPETLVEIGCETPQINYDAYNGKPYTYFYAISSDVDSGNPGTVRISKQKDWRKTKK